jgi:hypothetical protein
LKKNVSCNSKYKNSFTALFLVVLWLCISKMICRTWEGAPITFLNHSKWRRIWERSVKVFSHKQVLSDGPVYPSFPHFFGSPSFMFMGEAWKMRVILWYEIHHWRPKHQAWVELHQPHFGWSIVKWCFEALLFT